MPPGKRKRSIDVEEDISEIKVNIAEIKSDLKHHIKRTDQVEDMLLPIYKFKIWAQYSIVIVGAVVTILTLKGFL